MRRLLVAVNAPEFRWSKARNIKLKVLRTRSVTAVNLFRQRAHHW